MILHVCSKNEWDEYAGLDYYQPPGYAKEGFIHCCLKEQLPGVLHRYFEGQQELLLLHIDENKLTGEVKFEPGPQGELFPHVYGAINKSAVTDCKPIR